MIERLQRWRQRKRHQPACIRLGLKEVDYVVEMRNASERKRGNQEADHKYYSRRQIGKPAVEFLLAITAARKADPRRYNVCQLVQLGPRQGDHECNETGDVDAEKCQRDDHLLEVKRRIMAGDRLHQTSGCQNKECGNQNNPPNAQTSKNAGNTPKDTVLPKDHRGGSALQNKTSQHQILKPRLRPYADLLKPERIPEC